jgi:hypothetical protein
MWMCGRDGCECWDEGDKGEEGGQMHCEYLWPERGAGIGWMQNVMRGDDVDEVCEIRNDSPIRSSKLYSDASTLLPVLWVFIWRGAYEMCKTGDAGVFPLFSDPTMAVYVHTSFIQRAIRLAEMHPQVAVWWWNSQAKTMNF